jgi:hypothetical protein
MTETYKHTNWDIYYSKDYKITSYTRKTTEKLLLKLFNQYCPDINSKTIVELGGANSCFYSAIRQNVKPKLFHVIDNNDVGIEKFKKKIVDDKHASFENANVLELKPDKYYDLAFSIGLIEHFDVEGTAKAIKAHFDIVPQDGIVIISFPTPTFLYIVVRKICEIIGIWFFFDERPLEFNEVIKEASKHGTVLHKTINWKVILTQGFIVARKRH